MNTTTSRHHVVHSLSLSMLQQQVNALLEEGWTTIGTPTLAQPVDRSCPACWVQALYLQARPETEPQPLELHPKSKSPADIHAFAGGAMNRYTPWTQ